MNVKLSTKGQIVLPKPIRRRLGLHPGDPLNANIEAGRIVLTPVNRRRRRARIIADPATGLPMLCAGAAVPVLRSKDVEEILASFP
jgi:AbrB family looped-hinge helix DNA binding protein